MDTNTTPMRHPTPSRPVRTPARRGQWLPAARLTSLMVSLLVLALAGCAAAPVFDTQGVDRGLTPRAATARTTEVRGAKVLWGGVIIATANLKHRTQIEALAYPLDSDNRPDPTAEPLGRILIEKTGYLEPVDYAQGRLISAVGTLQGTRAGRVGQSAYTYPVLEATQVHLWPRYTPSNTRFHFGIGVIFH